MDAVWNQVFYGLASIAILLSLLKLINKPSSLN